MHKFVCIVTASAESFLSHVVQPHVFKEAATSINDFAANFDKTRIYDFEKKIEIDETPIDEFKDDLKDEFNRLVSLVMSLVKEDDKIVFENYLDKLEKLKLELDELNDDDKLKLELDEPKRKPNKKNKKKLNFKTKSTKLIANALAIKNIKIETFLSQELKWPETFALSFDKIETFTRNTFNELDISIFEELSTALSNEHEHGHELSNEHEHGHEHGHPISSIKIEEELRKSIQALQNPISSIKTQKEELRKSIKDLQAITFDNEIENEIVNYRETYNNKRRDLRRENFTFKNNFEYAAFRNADILGDANDTESKEAIIENTINAAQELKAEADFAKILTTLKRKGYEILNSTDAIKKKTNQIRTNIETFKTFKATKKTLWMLLSIKATIQGEQQPVPPRRFDGADVAAVLDRNKNLWLW